YIFVDPHKMDKKIDPKKLRYGSKIDDAGNSQREDYYTVKHIITPELVELNNGLTIRLIGIAENAEANSSATKYLSEKLLGQKVFLRYDEKKYDEEDHLLCYLYLSNKTFINAHLIKNGLVDADCRSDYKYKNKFIELGKNYV
ncbi:MAG: thermonuclease family protein, partial [Oscillospiraceae bacterium]|nr:thermonuclease family protein [Oscillospiraceae bacterium]